MKMMLNKYIVFGLVIVLLLFAAGCSAKTSETASGDWKTVTGAGYSFEVPSDWQEAEFEGYDAVYSKSDEGTIYVQYRLTAPDVALGYLYNENDVNGVMNFQKDTASNTVTYIVKSDSGEDVEVTDVFYPVDEFSISVSFVFFSSKMEEKNLRRAIDSFRKLPAGKQDVFWQQHDFRSMPPDRAELLFGIYKMKDDYLRAHGYKVNYSDTSYLELIERQLEPLTKVFTAYELEQYGLVELAQSLLDQRRMLKNPEDPNTNVKMFRIITK